MTDETQYSEFQDVPVVTRPQDHKPAAAVANRQQQEARNRPLTFEWDGEDWTLIPSDATSLEFLAALEDEQIIAALRFLLGKDQAARLIKGRKVEHLEKFFDAAGEAAGSGNR
ncbi:hypothetical protein ACFVWG_24030 [Kribbella sp. NPDC058245]|uniref:hypothetical protein n=1 Tax=Kribbella sp. NPDC058245 TaxID=3346399 RepID=UPI0036E7B0A8